MSSSSLNALYTDKSTEARELVALHKRIQSFSRTVAPIESRTQKLGTEQDGMSVRRQTKKHIDEGQALMKQIMADVNRISEMNMDGPDKKTYAEHRQMLVDEFSRTVSDFKRVAVAAEEKMKSPISDAAKSRTWGRFDTRQLTLRAAELQGGAQGESKESKLTRSKSELPGGMQALLRRKQAKVEEPEQKNQGTPRSPVGNVSEELWKAVSDGNVELVKQLVPMQRDKLNCHNEQAENATLLHLAASAGNLEIVQILQGKGADVNSKDANGQTPLHKAAEQGHIPVIKFLIGHRADVDIEDSKGKTALNWAARNGNLEAVQLLIGRSSHAKRKDHKGKTPMHEAVKFHNMDVARFLTEKNPKCAKCKDHNNVTPLHKAAFNGDLDMVSLLVEACPGALKRKDNKGKTALHDAASQGHLDIVRCLVEKRADIDSKDNEHKTPLHYAVKEGHFDIARYLVDQHADVNVKDSDGRIPLHEAAFVGNLEFVKYLVAHNSDVNCEDKTGSTPFNKAVEANQASVVEWWVTEASKENLPGRLAVSVNRGLLKAVREGNLATVKLLIENGADSNLTDGHGMPLANLAKEGNHNEVLLFLLENGADVDITSTSGEEILHFAVYNKPDSALVQKVFLRAARENNLDLMRRITARGASVNTTIRGGLTPLCLAVGFGRLEMAQFLIERGADVNPPVADPPLYLAVLSKNCELVKLLIERGAKTNILLSYKWTLLHFAAKDNSVDIARCLLEHGADINAKAADGETPMDVAIKAQANDVIVLFNLSSKKKRR